MTDPADVVPPAQPDATASADATARVPPDAPDGRAARRAALRELAAMIGVEVFY